MKKPNGLHRREFLAAASGAFFCACASMPTAPGAPGQLRTDGRACDHDLCRYFVRPSAEGEAGRCGLGLPEAFR